MSKAILVIDMPENCYECCLNNYHFCDVTADGIDIEHRPNWCPLKPAPELIEINYGSDEQDWEKGYNSCLEGILDI